MKVLVVDDNRFNRDLIGYILEDYGYSFICAEDGLQACRCVEQDKEIELVLMDVSMPTMDGFEATQKIRAMNIGRFLPIVFVTALSDEDTLSKCLSVGGDDFISKPISETVLLAKMKTHQRTAAIHHQLLSSNRSLQYHQKLVEREHAIVEHVFQNDMKRINVDCKNINFHISPMSIFNGDLLLVARSPSGGVYVLLGDFTGHGLSAAIGSLPVSDIFYSMAAKQVGVGDMAREMNLKLLNLLPDNMFFCAAIIEFNVRGDRISVWSGGMNDLILLNGSGEVERRVKSQYMPLAVLDTGEFEDDVSIVRPSLGAHLYVYTDGVIESMNTDGDFFGEEGLEGILCQKDERGNKIEQIFRALDDFRRGAEQKDDISLLEIACQPIEYGGKEGPACSAHSGDSGRGALAFPLRFSVNLAPEALRSGNNVRRLLDFFESLEGFREHRGSIYTVLSELYNNALEHGLLLLDSSLKESAEGFDAYYRQREQHLLELSDGEMIINIVVRPARGGIKTAAKEALHMSVTDSGSGFDAASVLSRAGDEALAFGRGIGIVRSLCDELIYSNNGRTASVKYLLS